jgi:periplasmic mercuric ion binding protein
MKTKILSLVALFMFGAFAVFAGNKTEKIKVLGACGMCETRIEKTAKAIDGVLKADWAKDTEVLEVKFDDTKTSVDKIEKALAEVGHDTEKYKASDEVYNKLPGCCHYDRTALKK